MNRTDRLLAIVLELQAKRMQRAEDLAATFEVSKRTIYRDILALCESGVPVVAMPGEGYSLMDGFFLPPLTFNLDEAMMLLLGLDVMAQNFDSQYRAAALSASSKITAVLPDSLREEAAYLQRCIRFISMAQLHSPDLLKQLRRAIIQRRVVQFRYQARFSANERGADSDSPAIREADPYALAHIGQTWYLIAYCHMRRARRNFRLDRMAELSLLDATFTRPADFEIMSQSPQELPLTVRVLFDADSIPWVREGRSYFMVDEEERADGLLVTLKVRHEEEIMQWLLGWGRHVHIIEPASLRQRLADETALMHQNYQLPIPRKSVNQNP